MPPTTGFRGAGHWRPRLTRLALASILAGSFIVALWAIPEGQPDLVALGFAFAVMVGTSIGLHANERRLEVGVVSGAALFAVTCAGLAVAEYPMILPLGVVALGTAVAVAASRFGRARWSGDFIVAGSPVACLVAVAIFRRGVEEFAIGALLFVLQFGYIHRLAKHVHKEANLLIDAESQPDVAVHARAGRHLWSCIVLLVVPAAVGFFLLVAAAADAYFLNEAAATAAPTTTLAAALLVTVLAAAASITVSRAFPRGAARRGVAATLVGGAITALTLLPMSGASLSSAPESLVVGALVALVVAEDLWANLYYLHELPLSALGGACIAAVAVAFGSAVAWLVVEAAGTAGSRPSATAVVETAFVVAAISIIVTWSTAVVLWEAQGQRSRTLHSPKQNVLQGCMVVGAGAVLAAAAMAIGGSATLFEGSYRAGAALLLGVGMAAPFFAPGMRALRGQLTSHEGRELRRRGADEEGMRRLGVHLRFQRRAIGAAGFVMLAWVALHILPSLSG